MTRLILYLTFIPLLTCGQQFKKTITPSDTFYLLNSIDTLTIPKGLPDGKWKVLFDNDTTRPQYIFQLKENKINGVFMSYHSNGSWASIGSYSDDSLWTFRTNLFGNIDTTFKTALWRYQGDGYIKEQVYKIPFSENDSIYNDNWFYENGRVLSSRTYHKKEGLLKEIWFYENGERSSMLEIHNNYSTNTEWTKDQKISSFFLDQNFSYQLLLESSDISFNRCDDCIVQTVFDKQGKIISTVSIDSSGKVRNFSSGGATLRYDTDGNVKHIEYWNKRNKWKLKDLK